MKKEESGKRVERHTANMNNPFIELQTMVKSFTANQVMEFKISYSVRDKEYIVTALKESVEFEGRSFILDDSFRKVFHDMREHFGDTWT